MTHTIRIPKPADPLSGILTSPARRWRPRECLSIQPEETPVRSSVAETDGSTAEFVATIRGLLLGEAIP